MTALLLTIVFMAVYYYGIRAVYVAGVSVLSSVLADYFSCTAMRKKYDWSDLSPVMSGLLLALLMPASVPYTIMAFSAAFMTIVCKHAFGGNKNLIFCPVCIAYIFTTLCFPSEVARYPLPIPFGSVDTANIVSDSLAHSYTYFLDSGASSAFSLLDLVWGKLAGPMGSSAVLIILICGIALYFFGDIPATVFFAGFGANVLINVLFPVGASGWYAVLNSLVAGSYLFVLIFMACDLRYTPKRAFSQAFYGVLFAGASYLIRMYTTIENGAIFALPLLCIFRDEFDRLTNALERLLKLLHRGIVAAAKWAAVQFDRLCEFIATKIHEAQKKSAEAKAANSEDKENGEETTEQISEDIAEAAQAENAGEAESAEVSEIIPEAASEPDEAPKTAETAPELTESASEPTEESEAEE